jgi:uncharacterized membrane protein YdjX (TVP38/TMEM64 family)
MPAKPEPSSLFTGKPHMTFDKEGRLKRWLKDKKNWYRIIVPLLLVIAFFVAARIIDLDQYLEIVRKWIWQFGPWGPTIFVGVYVTAVLLLLPGLPLTFVAALIFGSLKGYLIMLAASNLAAIIGFLVARYLARESFESRVRGFESFQKLMNLVEKNQWLAIPFVRLMPIFPFALNNYALGLTRVPFWRYLLFSEMIFLPMNAVWVFGANSFYSVITSGEVSWVVAGGATAAGFFVLALGYAGKRVFG